MSETKPPTEPVYQQPSPAAQPTYQKAAGGEQEWQHGLFECFEGEDNLCLKGTFCPCFVYGKTAGRIKNPTLQGYERFNSDCMTWAGLQFCCGLGWVVGMMKRTDIRAQYTIRGDGLSDCCISWCCHCCALIQQEKEVISRQQQTGLLSGGYVAPPPGMIAQPQ